MPVDTAASFVDAVQKVNLLESRESKELSALSATFPDPKGLAKELLRRGWLTPFQANQLLQGNGSKLVLGPYLLLERLGEGGMGEVFKARHRIMDRIVALKLIRKERLSNSASIGRFLREVKAAARLDHPNVVHALHADQLDGTYVLTMEYVEGIDLSKLVKKNGPLPVATACEYIRQAALGLQHAHEQGLVHRDIKPSNMLLAKAGAGAGLGTVKILDLGLAQFKNLAGDEGSSTLTEQSSVLGTPDFIAPEQAKHAKNVDIRADLYSLGCSLYFFLIGRVPHTGEALGEKLLKHIMDEPVPVEQLRPDVPAEVAGVVRKLMAKNPADRFQTPQELADVLETGLKMGIWPDAAPNHAISSIPSAPVTLLPEQTEVLTPSSLHVVAAERKGFDRRLLLLGIGAGGVFFLLGLVSLAFYLFRSSDRKKIASGTGKTSPSTAQKKDLGAPDLSKAKLLIDDDFHDPRSGFKRDRKENAHHLDYANGRYFVRLWPSRQIELATSVGYSNFACQLIGRVKRRSDGQWGIDVLGTDRKHGLRFVISYDGHYQLLASSQAQIQSAEPQVGPLRHSAVKAGDEFNKLLVVVRGRKFEAYVNSVRVITETLNWDITPGFVGIAIICRSEEFYAEFERFTIWSAEGLPA